MLKLLRLIIFRNIRSLIILFFVVLFASTGFLLMRELTANIEASVARETRPLFGADLRISHEGVTARPIIETFGPYLSGETYTWGEIREFSTTLISGDGKTGLAKVIAYTGEYPQKGILETLSIDSSSGQQLKNQKVSVSDDLWNRYASGGRVEIDGRQVVVTDRITKSSDLGLSFGNENSLIILPLDLLSGSLLISSGSRLSQDLLVSFAREGLADAMKEKIGEEYKDYRIRTFTERSERSLDTVEQLSDYILLILLASFVFAAVVMRSAHDRLFASLSRTLTIVEILGLTRRRQAGLFLIVYSIILPLAALLSIGLAYIGLHFIAKLPGAEEFTFLTSAMPFSFALLALLVLASFFPAWRSKIDFSLTLASRDLVTPLLTLVVVYLAVLLIFTRPIFSLALTLGALVGIGALFALLSLLYRLIFRLVTPLRGSRFLLFDALRTHVRPLSPTLPVTLSLVTITTCFIVFLLFSLSFRSKLTIDATTTSNIYAINILESDREKVEKYLSGSGDMYSILRARIASVNSRTLAEHLSDPKPSGEFTREFNITTTPLPNRILRGKSILAKDEVSVDDEFSKRLRVDLGDRIEFLLSGKSVTLTIANIRDSKKTGFTPFFYFSFDPEAFRTAPKTYFATAYAPDTEVWKRDILANSGPHVTFIDVENILTIVRDIAGKVLSVISLFLAVISLFALFAIIALFGQMEAIERTKARLYPLFGLTPERLRSSLQMSRASIFALSWILSAILGITLSFYVFSSISFLSLSWAHIGLVSALTFGVYIVLVGLLRPKL